MTLSEEVRAHCAQVVADARWVRIDLDRAGAVGRAGSVSPPQLDPARHYSRARARTSRRSSSR
jgi:hypothetical protein